MSDHFETRRRVLGSALAVGLAPIAATGLSSRALANAANLDVAFTRCSIPASKAAISTR